MVSVQDAIGQLNKLRKRTKIVKRNFDIIKIEYE